MNGIIALCHFCELHGPSILFCTQAFHSQDPHPLFTPGGALTDDDLPESSSGYSCPGLQRSQSTSSVHQGPGEAGPVAREAGGEVAGAESEPNVRTAATKSTEHCEACRSFQAGHPGLISTDMEAKVSYISNQKPHHPEVFTMVRQACVRSLSCEVCPGREGPMFFGDDHRGHVFSHTFFLSDMQARGFNRWYSVIVVMMDKIFLLNSWPFLLKHIRRVIGDLQTKASAVYDTEHARAPQRPHRLTQHSMTPANFRQQRGANKQARSLPELTDDKQIFRKLHLAFTWILKAGGNRLTEKLLEGPPTEDSIIDMEKHEETEEGFVVVFSKKESVEDDKHTDAKPTATVDIACEATGQTDVLTEVEGESQPTFTTLRHLLKVLGTYKFHELAHHVVIGNQVVVRSHLKATVTSIIEVLKVLLPKGCCRIIHHSETYEDSWRCNFLGLTPGVTLPPHIDLYVTLKIYKIFMREVLLPKGCCRIIHHSDTYEDSWRCNFLGLTPGVTLPPHIDLYVTLDVLEPEPKDMCLLGASPCLSLTPEVAEFAGYTFMINSPQTLPEKGPSVLCKMELSLLNDKLGDTVVEQCLICLKEEWMNKVKVLFKFTKAGGNRSDDDTRKLLQVVGAQTEDKAVLKFWMTGLSVQYRNHMLSSAISQT